MSRLFAAATAMLEPDSIRIELDRSGLCRLVIGERSQGTATPDVPVALIAPVQLKRRGVEARLILGAGQGVAAVPDRKLIDLLARAHRWFDQLTGGEIGSAREIARRDRVATSEVSRTLQLAFLAPDIVEAILAGRQPVELTPRILMRVGDLPLDWRHQRRLLGFPV